MTTHRRGSPTEVATAHHFPHTPLPPQGAIGARVWLANRFLNKGTAFTHEERQTLHIRGRLPYRVETLAEQISRVYRQFTSFDQKIAQYQFLRGLQDTNSRLFYAFTLAYVTDVLPILYTPTVGEACIKFGQLYSKDHGLYFSKYDQGHLADIIDNAERDDIDIVVITDGSRILGLGDLGANGMGIPIGKVSLYVAGGGLAPFRCLPVTFDAGTDTDTLRNDPLYLGTREKRLDDATFYALMDEFMAVTSRRYPNAVIQFEDFSNNHCFDLLERYRYQYRCFNDDIQGTGVVIAAGFLNAVKLSGLSPLEHRILVYGAGSAATGVIDQICSVMASQFNISHDDMMKTVYLVDTKGLVTSTRKGEQLAKHKVHLARKDVAEEDNGLYRTLEQCIRAIRPTALIGLAGAGPHFTEDLIRIVASHTARPIIFPLSNPTSKSEIHTDNAYRWTDGRAIVASGSPYPSFTTAAGQVLTPSQGNNMYIFPGVGLGSRLSRTRIIPEGAMTAAALKLASLTTPAEFDNGLLYPPLSGIREVSAEIAFAVIEHCVKAGLTPADATDIPTSVAEVKERMWVPDYSE